MTDTQPPRIRSLLRRRLPLEIASTLVLLALVIYAVEKMHPDLLWAALQAQMDWALLAGLVLSLGVYVMHGIRLGALLRRDFFTSFNIVNMGSILNVVLPFRIGDIVRVYMANRLFRLPGAPLIAAALIEKFFDLGFVMFLAASMVLAGAMKIVPIGMLIPLLAVLAGCASLVFVSKGGGWIGFAIKKLPPTLGHQIASVRQHLVSVRLVPVTAATLFIWAFNIASVWATFAVLLPASHFSFIDAVALTVITALAVAVPGAPAGLGIFEAGVVAYLSQSLSVPPESALASALLCHAIIVIPSALALLIGMLRRLV